MYDQEYTGLTSIKPFDFQNKEKSVQYYVRYMLNRTQRIFRYENLPDTLPQLYLERYLQFNGNCIIAKHEDKLYTFFGRIGAIPNEYYLGTEFVVANPYLKLSKSFKIGEDCVLMRNDSSMEGLIPLCTRYATMLAENDITMIIECVNSRIPVISAVHTDGEKQGFEEFMRAVIKGDLGKAVQIGFEDSFNTFPYSERNSKITNLIEFHQYIKGSWYNEIGIKSPFNMKREAISASEASLSDDLLLPLIDDMFEWRKKNIEEVNSMFGTNISVSLNSAWKDIADERELELENLEAEIENLKNDEFSQLNNEGGDDDVSVREVSEETTDEG